MVCLEQLPPRTIAELAGPFRGTNDVGEQHRREEAIEHGILVLHRGEKCLDRVDRPVDVSNPGKVVRSGKLHSNGAGHVLGEVSALGRIGGVATPKDQARDAKRPHDGSGIGLEPHTVDGDRGARARALPKVPDHPGEEVLVAGQ
jgi:hypothetical protein